MKMIWLFSLLVTIAVSFCRCDKSENKYSEKANTFSEGEKYDPDFRKLQKPFRMAKLNLVWVKAQHRLSEPKLKSLFTELKIHDKEELAWKQLNSQHKDKDGLKEDELRKKLIGIMSTYDLLEHFGDTQNPDAYKEFKPFQGPVDNYKNKSLFKDKKLNRLWEKAEVAGFTPEELEILKQEFGHHQEKIDFYYKLLEDVTKSANDVHLNAIDEEDHDSFNEIVGKEEGDSKKNDVHQNANELREKHRELRDNIDRLERMAAKGPNSQEFVEPKVQGLWRVAVASDFTQDELASMKIELLHYESRLLKLRHMNAEHALAVEKVKVANIWRR